MKLGKSLVDLAKEVERQTSVKRDFVADTRALEMTPEAQLVMGGDYKAPLAVRDTAHAQIAQRVGIPKAYYDKMRGDAPALLASNVNHWFHSNPEKRMVRTLDGQARAFLSERYRPLDNFELLGAALPVLSGMKVEFASCEVTERHLYLKVLFPELRTDVPGSKQVGDTVQAGLVISNSEIGMSSLRVEPLLYRLVCQNGLISNVAMRKYHVGRGHEGDEALSEYLRDETRQTLDKGFWLKVQDIIRTAVTKDVFEAQVAKMAEATVPRLEGDPTKAIEVVRQKLSLTELQAGSMLRNLIDGGDLSKWGVVNAVTALANTTEDYEEATRLERAGGLILELSQRDWATIAKAA